MVWQIPTASMLSGRLGNGLILHFGQYGSGRTKPVRPLRYFCANQTNSSYADPIRAISTNQTDSGRLNRPTPATQV